QTFRQDVSNKITTPFYAGKVTYGISDKHVLTFSTFGDFTKQEGFLFGNSGFGADPNSFLGTIESGGHNYTVRLNSTFSPRFIGEFVFGAHLQRANTIPLDSVAGKELIADNFAVLRNGQVLTPVDTNVVFSGLNLAYVNGAGGGIERNFIRQGFGLISNQNRNRYEFAVRMQTNIEKHAFKYGLEYSGNRYQIDTRSTGPTRDFKSTDSGVFNGYRLTNNFVVCQTSGANIVCPNQTTANRANALITGGALTGAGITGVTVAPV